MSQAFRHLKRVPITLPNDVAPIYFVTCCCAGRRVVFNLAERVDMAHRELLESRTRLSWIVGSVVYMPDHVHLFCCPPRREGHLLSRFIGAWRSAVSRRLRACGLEGPLWQRGFFDHVLRSGESYSEKWEYTRSNPERAGVADFRRWFEVDVLRM